MLAGVVIKAALPPLRSASASSNGRAISQASVDGNPLGAGDPLRSLGPFVAGIPNRDLSASAAYFHAGKRSVVVAPPAHITSRRRPQIPVLATPASS